MRKDAQSGEGTNRPGETPLPDPPAPGRGGKWVLLWVLASALVWVVLLVGLVIGLGTA